MKRPTLEPVVGFIGTIIIIVIFLVRDTKDLGAWGFIATIITLALAWGGWKAGRKSLGKHGDKDERLLRLRDKAGAIAYLVAVYVLWIILLLDEFFSIQLALQTALYSALGISGVVFFAYYFIAKRR